MLGFFEHGFLTWPELKRMKDRFVSVEFHKRKVWKICKKANKYILNECDVSYLCDMEILIGFMIHLFEQTNQRYTEFVWEKDALSKYKTNASTMN